MKLILLLNQVGKLCLFVVVLLPFSKLVADPCIGNTHQFKFEFVHKYMLLEAEINGIKGKLLFDTGLESTVLNKRYFKGRGPGKLLRGISLQNTKAQQLKVDLKIGSSFSLINTETLVTPLHFIEKHLKQPILGLLGVSCLTDYEIVIHYDTKKIILYPINEWGDYQDPLISKAIPDKTFPIKMNSHMPCILISFGSKKIMVGLDTGAGFNLLNKLKRRVFAPFLTDPITMTLIESDGKKSEMESAIFRNFYIAEIPIEGLRIALRPLNRLNRVDSEVRIDGIFNPLAMRQPKVGFNLKKKEWYIWHKRDPAQKMLSFIPSDTFYYHYIGVNGFWKLYPR